MTQAEYLYVFYKVIVGIVLTIGWAIILYIPMRKAGKSSSFLLLWSTALATIILIVKQILDLVTPLSDAVLSYFLGIFIGVLALAFLFNFKQAWLNAAPKESILFPVSLTPKKIHLRDLIQFAILLEEQGCDFYKKLGEKVKSVETRKITEWLASQELRHKKILKNVLFQWLSLPMDKTLLSSLTQDVKTKGIFSNPLSS